MPIERVAVVHKFGIISHSQRLALEDRLVRKSIPPPPTFLRSRRKSSEVTDDFVAKFNDSNEEDKIRHKNLAHQMLVRAKRRAGTRDGGSGEHVDLPKAWAELTLLAQCNDNKIQEESLTLLITSLDQAPLTSQLIPSLFYLGKSCLHWLRKKSIDQPYLRTGELHLIKMGHLVFTRLYYHLLAAELQEYQEDKDSLLQYMAGIAGHEEIYKPFPGALLSIRFITEVGYLICAQGADVHEVVADKATAPGAEPRGETESGTELLETSADHSEHAPRQPEYSNVSKVRESAVPSTIHDVSPTLWHALDVWRSVTHRGTGLKQALRGLSMCGTGLATESWLDVSIAFRVLSEAAKQEQTILHTLQSLGAGILTRPAALTEIHARHVDLCDHCLSRMTETKQPAHTKNREQTEQDVWDQGKDLVSSSSADLIAAQTPSFIHGIKDFARLGISNAPEVDTQSEDSETIRSRSDRDETSSEASFADVSSVGSVQGESRRRSPLTRRERESRSNLRNIDSHGDFSSDSESEDQPARGEYSRHQARPVMSAPVYEQCWWLVVRCLDRRVSYSCHTHVRRQTGPDGRRTHTGTGVRFSTDKPQVAEVSMETASLPSLSDAKMERTLTKESLYSGQTCGSSVTLPVPAEESSQTESVVRTDTSLFPEGIGILGWRWELAYSYAECMTAVCLHGNTSAIQKSALVGAESRPKKLMYGGKVTGDKSGLGLVGLLNLKYADKEEGPSLKLLENVLESPVNLLVASGNFRFYGFKNGLVRVCRHCHGDSNKDGVRTVAWGALMKHHSVEKDARVLEALKIAHVEADLDMSQHPPEAVDFSLLSARLAAGLSAVLLPPLPSPVPAPSAPSRARSRAGKMSVNMPVPRREPKRPSLRQEILLSQAARETPVDYGTRMNHQLMGVIEDQWKKELHEMEEEEARERKALAEKQMKEMIAIEGKRAKESEARREKRERAREVKTTNQNHAGGAILQDS